MNPDGPPVESGGTSVARAVMDGRYGVTDTNHRTIEFFEDRGGKEVKTTEIGYTRKS